MKKAAKLAKSTNPTSLAVDSSKNTRDKETKKTWIQQYDEINFMKLHANDRFIERLAEELINWARHDEDALRISDFHWARNICDDTYYNWVKKFDTLNKAHKLAMNAIASRREKGMLKKTMSESGVLRSLYKFDPMYAEIRQDEINAKIEVAKANAEAMERPANIILGQLPGLEEYKKQIEDKNEEQISNQD